METGATYSTPKDYFMRECVHVLDNIYSHYNCTPFIKTLYEIEVNLFNEFYKDFNAFKFDLLKIPPVTGNYIDQLKATTPTNPTVEEYSRLPIYSSIQIHNESILYAVNIATCSDLHFPMIEQIRTNKTKTPVQRLYVRRRSSLLMEAKENVNALFVIFLNTKLEPLEGSDELFRIRSIASVVHPLGNFEPSNNTDLEGWMKVKLIRSKNLDTVISNRIVSKIFYGDSEVVRKLAMKPNTKLKYARENEIRHYFLHTIMSSNYSRFEYYYSIPYDNISTKKSVTIKDYNPLQYSADIFSAKSTATVDSTSTILRLTTKQDRSPIAGHWKKIQDFSRNKDCPIILKKDHSDLTKKSADAQGYFKQVFFMDKQVIQLFQKSTSFQRVTEIACLLKLRGQKYIGQIKEVIINDSGAEVIGLTMDRYEMTLKEYLKLNNHRRLTNYQRMDIIIQMLKSLKVIHEYGIAHRDLSTVNFMINICKNEAPLDDGSTKINLFLIDFGKSVFFRQEDAKRWWVSTNEEDIYKDETKPKSEEELIIWCKNLPYIMARPDHGYKFYRSIQTLPKSSKDHDYLPHLINPFAEDIYSLGTLIWKIFSGVEPWPGLFDTDFKKLRETVGSDYMIDHILEREVPGENSKKLLKKFLRTDPEIREPIPKVLDWILQPQIIETLLEEWDSQDSNQYKTQRSNIPNTTQAGKCKPSNNPITVARNDENRPTKKIGRPRGTLNKRTLLKIRMGEVGKTRTIDGISLAPKTRGRPRGSGKKPNLEFFGPKRNKGRPRKYKSEVEPTLTLDYPQ